MVGRAIGMLMTADLVTQALDMALMTRKPQSVTHHSDQSSQYTSIQFDNRYNFEGKHSEQKSPPSKSSEQPPPEDGLPTGCLATVDKTPQGLSDGPSPCPQASDVDKPASFIVDTLFCLRLTKINKPSRHTDTIND